MTTSYRYNEPSETQFEVLPAGDYDFIVLSAGEPYTKDNGNIVLPLKLEVGKQKAHVFANATCGKDSAGEPFDAIAKFLKSVNRTPTPGQEPQWNRLEGARGRCHIKVGVSKVGKYAGQDRNEVGWFIYNQDVKQSAQSFTPSEVKLSADAVRRAAGDPDLDAEPSDIPF